MGGEEEVAAGVGGEGETPGGVSDDRDAIREGNDLCRRCRSPFTEWVTNPRAVRADRLAAQEQAPVMAAAFVAPAPDSDGAADGSPELNAVLARSFAEDRDAVKNSTATPNAVIQQLPAMVLVRPSQLEDSEGARLDCIVCCEQFQLKERVTGLGCCHHIFHQECICLWLNVRSTCPICRSPVVTRVAAGGKRERRGRMWGPVSEGGGDDLPSSASSSSSSSSSSTESGSWTGTGTEPGGEIRAEKVPCCPASPWGATCKSEGGEACGCGCGDNGAEGGCGGECGGEYCGECCGEHAVFRDMNGMPQHGMDGMVPLALPGQANGGREYSLRLQAGGERQREKEGQRGDDGRRGGGRRDRETVIARRYREIALQTATSVATTTIAMSLCTTALARSMGGGAVRIGGGGSGKMVPPEIMTA